MWGKSAHATRWVHSGCNEGSTAGNSASHRLVQPALLRQNDQAPAYGVLVSLPVDAMSVPAVSELGATLGDSCRIVVFLKRQRRGSACLAAPPQAGCKSLGEIIQCCILPGQPQGSRLQGQHSIQPS